MATIDAQRVTPRGIRPATTALAADTPIVVPSSRSAILVVRNRATGSSPGDLILTLVTSDDGDGVPGPAMWVTIPPVVSGSSVGPTFIALVGRLADSSTGLITFMPSGDVSRADVAVIDRAL
jgi:hypothetical protein